MSLPIARMPLVVLLLTLATAVNVLAAPPSDLQERERNTPDLPQSQQSLPGRGGQYCGPVSASNALAWLAGRGYPELLPASQLELARTLGSPERMNTAKTRGTGPQAMIRGLVGYVQERGYKIEQIDYYGWRKVKGDSVNVEPGHPNAMEIARTLDTNSIGLLNVGWYKQEGDNFRRVGGHWVTLLGADEDHPATFVVHDPAGRSPQGTHERVTAQQIETGKLINPRRKSELDAAGAWQLGGELKINTRKGATTSVLDNVVVLRLE